MREAIIARSMFNLLDTREGDKVDFWLLTDDDFDRTRFDRRYAEVFEPPETPVFTASGAATSGR